MEGLKFVEWKEIPIEQLAPDPMNVRKYVGDVADLATSIRQYGWTERPVVRWLQGGQYGIVSGVRRFHAAKLLGLRSIPCDVYEMDDYMAKTYSLIENEVSKTLTNEEVAYAVYDMVRMAGSMTRVAKSLGKSVQWVSYQLSLLEATEKAVEEGLSVVDKRTRWGREAVREEGGRVVGKVELRKAFKGLKRLKFIKNGGREDGNGELNGIGKGEAEKPKEQAEEPKEPAVTSLREAVESEWRPNLFKAVEKGPYLHEVLKRPEVQLAIPKTFKPDLVQPSGQAPFKGYLPVVRLSPPFENITVFVCPNCYNVLRSVGREGAPIVCLDCGFPSHEQWKRAE